MYVVHSISQRKRDSWILDLTGIAMAETVKGIQDAGVIACAKHFIGNERECIQKPPRSIILTQR